MHDFLREHSGSAFDPVAVELFFRAISEGPELVAVGAESDKADDDSRDL